MGSEQSKKEPSIEDILQPLKQKGIFDQQTCEVGRLIVKHLQQKQPQHIQKYFESRQQSIEVNYQAHSSVCMKVIKKQEIAYECLTCQYVSSRYYCEDCFDKESHAMHEYHTVQGKKVLCECGNDQVLEQNFFCKKHHATNTVLKPEQVQIKKEIKLFIWMLLFLKSNPNNPKLLKIPPQNCQYFGEQLLKYILNIIKNKRIQIAIAEALLDKVDNIKFSQVKLKVTGSCLLEDLIYQLSQVPSMVGMLVDIINQSFWVGKINKALLQIYYKVLLTGDALYCLKNVLSKLQHNFLLCYKNQLEHFSDLNNCRFFLNRPIQDPQQLESQYTMFYAVISKILSFKNSTKMITNIMKQTPFSRFFNFQHEGRKYKQSTNTLTIKVFFLARRIIKVIEDKDVLRAIVMDCLEAIKKSKAASFNLIFQRSFALALYQYFDFRIPEADKLKDFLSKGNPNPQEMILNFWQSKDLNFDHYAQSVIKRQKGEQCPSQVLLATDQIYLQIIFSILTTKQEAISLYKRFVSQKVLNSERLIEGFDKIKENLLGKGGNIKRRLQQFNSFVSILSGSFNTNLPQLIIKASQNSDRQSIDKILTFLTIIFDGCSAAEFKTHGQRLVDEEQVVRFIKEKLVVQGKKIHLKGETQNSVIHFPYSEYFPMDISDMVIERMISMCLEQGKKRPNVFTEEETLRHLLVLLFACISYVQQNPDCQNHVQNQLKRLLKNILAFSGQQKGKEYLTIIHRVHKCLNGTSSVIQNFLKKVLESADKPQIIQVNSQNARTHKKKQKLNEMKSKQKFVLQAFQVEGEAHGGAECIVCKNSKAGSPLLLGYFGYKNIFNKIVSTNAPFLQFSSCGHHIHQECLQESHKGDFKIWYPCILCKSICNILLPSVSSAQNEGEDGLFNRVITFLKNLGGIYTFFYQDRQQLIQFNLDSVQGVFPLLFKTLIYQITFYPILNLQYFQRSQLPVTRFLFNLLRFTSQKLNGVAIVKKLQPLGDPLFVGIFKYVADRLAFLLRKQSPSLSGSDLPSDIVAMVEEILYILDKNDEKIEILPKQTKQFRDTVEKIFLKPPQDLRQLQSQSRECASCQKVISNCQLCLLCEWACCSKCSEVKKVHALQAHLSESIFIRNFNGKYIYVHEQLLGEFNSLYVDFLGQEYNSTEKAAAGNYLLSREKWENIVEDLLCNRIHREIMKFQ